MKNTQSIGMNELLHFLHVFNQSILVISYSKNLAGTIRKTGRGRDSTRIDQMFGV